MSLHKWAAIGIGICLTILIANRILTPPSNHSKLQAAAASWDTNAMQGILADEPELRGFRFDRGMMLLHLAAEKGDLAFLEFLLSIGCDVEGRDKTGRTPLFVSIVNKKYDVSSKLIASGANVNSSNMIGSTPLHHAAHAGDIEGAKMLLSNKAATNNVTNVEKATSLHWACGSGHLEVVKLLVEHGADVTATTIQGKTALDIAIRAGNADIAIYLKQLVQ